MNFFGSNRFVLASNSARALYENCRTLPVFDFHNHLSPQFLYENPRYEDMAQFWLGGDHYIWRAMRLAGVEEDLITGGATGRDKFLAWAKTLDGLVGCPLYVWIQMQMSFLFDEEPLTAANAPELWERCNAKLRSDDFTPRALLKRFGVTALCTTDEPFDSLEWHAKLQAEVEDLLVLPAFRPDKLLAASKDIWLDSVKKLEVSEGMAIRTLEELKERGLWIVGATMDGEDVADANLSGPLALVIGAEGEGISSLVEKNGDMKVSLPMRGHIESLNASVAAGVLLYAVLDARRR